MSKFIDIDGNLIKRKSITNVTNISSLYPMVFGSNYANFEFYLEYDNKSLRFYESFRIGWFSNKPKSVIEKDCAYNTLVEKRNDILLKIK